jgi:hypothetical protein
MKPMVKAALGLGTVAAFGSLRVLYRGAHRLPLLEQDSILNYLATGLVGLLIVAFVLLAWRDLAMLFDGGPRRVLAMARHAIQEAWSARVWGVLILWVIAAGVLLALARPFDETERVPEYLTIMLRSQELLVLVFVTVLACLSFPRERDRRTIITTGSKPVSRLEIFLGKVLGFVGVGLGLLLAMGLMSWMFLLIVDVKVRATARHEIALDKGDVDMRRVERIETLANGGGRAEAEADQYAQSIASIESKRDLAANGSLRADNYIATTKEDTSKKIQTAARGGMQVAGKIEYPESPNDPPLRYIRGGSYEKAVYRFPQRDPSGRLQFVLAPRKEGDTGVLVRFEYVAAPVTTLIGFRFPREIQINVIVRGQPAGLEQVAQIVKLRPPMDQPWDPQKNHKLVYTGGFTIERPERFFPFATAATGLVERPNVEVEITCVEPTVFLAICESSQQIEGMADVGLINVNADGYYQPCPTAPRVYGWEKRDKQQFRGPDPKVVAWENGKARTMDQFDGKYLDWPYYEDEVASWYFPNVKRSDLPIERVKLKGQATEQDCFKLAMQLDVEKQANYGVTPKVKVTIHKRLSTKGDPTTFWEGDTEVIEKRITPIYVPAELLDPSGGELFVELRCMVPGHWFSAVDNSVRLEQAPSLFVLNLFKSEMIVFVEMTLLVMTAVAFSIRLGWAVALLSTATVYLLGMFLGFITEVQQDSVLNMIGLTPGGTSPGLGYRIADWTLAFLFKILHAMAYMMPDFTRYDPTAYITESRNIPWMVMATHLGMMALWTIPFVALGYLFIRKQELA